MVFWTFSKFWKNRNNLETSFFFKIFKKNENSGFLGDFLSDFLGRFLICKLFRFLGNFEKRRFVDFLKILKKNEKRK